jgi:ABC-type nitrate/sulfonate/bicarbonate transport system substrate-binding protein
VSGQVDAFASFQTNQPIALAQKGIKTVTFLLADYGYNTFADAFVVSEKTLADKTARATVKKILIATIRGWQDSLKDPAAAANVVVSGPGKSLGLRLHDQTLTARAEVPLVQTAATRKHGLFWMDPAGIAVNMASMKRIGITIKQSDLFTNELLQEIYHGRNHV